MISAHKATRFEQNWPTIYKNIEKSVENYSSFDRNELNQLKHAHAFHSFVKNAVCVHENDDNCDCIVDVLNMHRHHVVQDQIK